MSGLPIRVRVTAALFVVVTVVLGASGWFLYARLENNLFLGLDRELQQRAQDLASVVRVAGPRVPLATGGGFVERGESYAQLLDRYGRVITATSPLSTTHLLDSRNVRAALHGPIYLDHGPIPGLNEPSRLLATSVSPSARTQNVLVVGATAQNNAETLASFRHELLIAGPFALLLTAAAGYGLAGLSLRQVEHMRRRAAAISAETAHERLPLPATGDEVQRLGETLNEMLDRLEAALERERGFVADAGHELRTPLALLRTELETTLRYGGTPEELRQAVQTSFGEVDRLTELAEDLLLLASTERGKLPLRRERLAASELLDSVATRFAWRAESEGRWLDASAGADIVLTADRLRLEQALGNLVENALRYGGGPVHLEAVAVEGSLELHVRDAGAGFSPAFVHRAFDRFARERRSGEDRGAGLGLSIVRVIAEAHGGRAYARNGPSGGADVWIVLPNGASLGPRQGAEGSQPARGIV